MKQQSFFRDDLRLGGAWMLLNSTSIEKAPGGPEELTHISRTLRFGGSK
jgi:hypothetical protein